MVAYSLNIMSLKPVRKIRPSSRSITGKRSSKKNQAIHHFESTLERDFLTLLEFDDTVEDYSVQPVTIHYTHNSKSARYTPDVVVFYKPDLQKAPLLVEIKYEAELRQKWDYYTPKFTAADQYATCNGYQFKVFTEKEIRTDYLQNIKFLSRYYHTSIDEGYAKKIAAELDKRSATTPQELLTASNQEENAKILYTIWQMLSRKIIACDMQWKIIMTSKIWKGHNPL